VGAAAAVGFAAVPKKLHVIRPDAETLEELAKKELLVVTSESKALAQQERKGILATLAALAGTLAVRGATSYLTGRLTQAARRQGQSDGPPRPGDAGTDSPYGVPR
jgi:hypothetical protein